MMRAAVPWVRNGGGSGSYSRIRTRRVPVVPRLRMSAPPDCHVTARRTRTMDEISDRGPEDLLRSTVFSLEAEYRAYRRAAERYHARAEHGFQLALNLLLEPHGGVE